MRQIQGEYRVGYKVKGMSLKRLNDESKVMYLVQFLLITAHKPAYKTEASF